MNTMNKIFTLLAALLLSAPAFAADGDVKKTTVDGVEWTYTIVSESDKTCMLGGSATGDDGTVVYYPAIDVNTTGNVTIPGTLDGYTVVTIGKEAFRGCKISAVSIPAEVTYIDDNAFADCSNLVKVICNGQPYDISESAFEGLYSQATVYYPEDCGEEFQSKKGWSKFSKWYEQGVEEDYLNEFKEVIMHLREMLYVAHENLVKKATQSEAPELYNEYDYCSDEINYIGQFFERIIWEGCVTIQNAKDFRERLRYLDKSIYEFYQKVEQYQPIVKIAINEENFPDANFRAIVAASDIDKDQDGYLSEEEITAIKKLKVSYKSIADLKGIEYFTSITELKCHGNQLTSLDLSNNMALISLECDHNRLTSLDLSNNMALISLECDHNRLTSLDLSNNTALTKLWCFDSQLTSLDLSKNTALVELYCENNQLTSLDLSNNTALTDLDCENNQLTSLDVSKNTALEVLHCYDNLLTSLDVSKNTALTDFWCNNNQLTSIDVSNNSALHMFYCKNNQLTSLDLSKNMALDYLVCENNQLTSLDVSNNTALTSLWCSNNQLTSLDVSKNTALKQLDCANNQLTSIDVSKNTALKVLYCANNQLTSLDLSNNAALAWLDTSNNPLTSIDVSKNTALVSLWCIENQLTSLDVSNNTALEQLDTSKNQLTSLDLSNNAALTYLRTSNNPLTSLDVSKNTALITLVCDGNQLISLDLTNNTALNFIRCYNNQIGETEMGKLVESLPEVSEGRFYVKMLMDDSDKNIITKSQVAAAKEKGWTVYAYEPTSDGYYNSVEYEGSDPQDLNPVDGGDKIDIGTEINTDTNLDGNVVGNILYNISSGNGEYNAQEGCLVINKPTSDETMSTLEGKDIFGEDVKDNFTGIVLKVAEGSGKVAIEAETTGPMVLKMKVGNEEPLEMEFEGKLKVKFPYNVTEETYVYIYGSTKAAQQAKGMRRANGTDGTLKIFGIEIEKNPTAIDDIFAADKPMDIYTLSGQKVRSGATSLQGLPAGVYIVGGKKVVVSK